MWFICNLRLFVYPNKWICAQLTTVNVHVTSAFHVPYFWVMKTLLMCFLCNQEHACHKGFYCICCTHLDSNFNNLFAMNIFKSSISYWWLCTLHLSGMFHQTIVILGWIARRVPCCVGKPSTYFLNSCCTSVTKCYWYWMN